MKLNLEPSVKSLESASASLARARTQLRQVVGVALTGSLEALNEHIATQWLAPQDGGLAVQTNAYRLREVLERDRALMAAQPADDGSAPDAIDGAAVALADGGASAVEDRAVALPDEDGSLEASTARAEAIEPARTEPLTVTAVPNPVTASERKERKRARGREPIRTRTMAKVLVAQGEHERALSIYQELAAQDADDASLQRELAALRARLDGDEPVSAE